MSGNKGARYILAADAISWTEREGLQHIELVIGELGVVQKPLGVEAKWLFEVLVVVVDGPLPGSNESLLDLLV